MDQRKKVFSMARRVQVSSVSHKRLFFMYKKVGARSQLKCLRLSLIYNFLKHVLSFFCVHRETPF